MIDPGIQRVIKTALVATFQFPKSAARVMLDLITRSEARLDDHERRLSELEASLTQGKAATPKAAKKTQDPPETSEEEATPPETNEASE